jgi:hypothetical protein
MKKPFIRSPLDKLPLHQKQQLLAWLTTGGPDGVGIPYDEARRRLRSEFGFATSTGSLCRFHSRSRTPLVTPPETIFDPVKNTLTIVIKLTR